MRAAYITGRLGKEPEVFSPQGSEYSVIKFSVANNDESKKAQDGSWDNVVNWFDCEYWTKKPQPWLQKLSKGVEVCLECTIKQSQWEKDGQKHSRIIFVVNKFPVVVGAAGPSARDGVSGGVPQAPVQNISDLDDDSNIPF